MKRWSAKLVLAGLCAGACGSVGEGGAGEDRLEERLAMVAEQIEARGVRDPRVLAAMRAVPRHRFVPEEQRRLAYGDSPLPIGLGQTISQPYIVAYMTEALELRGGERVLEIGTGSGYQAAVLAGIAGVVYSVEIVKPLHERAAGVLGELGLRNVHLRWGDGYGGWREKAPFDAILVTAAPDHVPLPLIEQLASGGRLVLPVGGISQKILRLRRTEQGIEREELIPVRFVPMTGEAQR